jgi:hypothetical protein
VKGCVKTCLRLFKERKGDKAGDLGRKYRATPNTPLNMESAASSLKIAMKLLSEIRSKKEAMQTKQQNLHSFACF